MPWEGDPDEAWRNVGSTKQAEKRGWGVGVSVQKGRLLCEPGAEDGHSLPHQPAGPPRAHLPPPRSSDLGQVLWNRLALGFILRLLGVRTLAPPTIAMATISTEIVTKETVAMVMATRYKRQAIGCQFCLETDSSPSPSTIIC